MLRVAKLKCQIGHISLTVPCLFWPCIMLDPVLKKHRDFIKFVATTRREFLNDLLINKNLILYIFIAAIKTATRSLEVKINWGIRRQTWKLLGL